MTESTEPRLPVSPFENASARAVFLAWERLRVVYNAALAVVVLVFAWPALSKSEFYLHLACGVVGANVCLCLGPVVEGYLVLSGAERRAVRWIVFVPGLLLACFLTYLSMTHWAPVGD